MTSQAAIWAPVRHEEDAGYDWWDYFDKHRTDPMPGQVRDWTCSACSVDWVARATALDPTSTREKVVGEMGYPGCIDEAMGLKDVRCAHRVMEGWGVQVGFQWVDWPMAYSLCESTTGILNSKTWYHYVAVRGVRNGNLWVANSAPGWKGIWDDITPGQFNAWAGSWNLSWIVR